MPNDLSSNNLRVLRDEYSNGISNFADFLKHSLGLGPSGVSLYYFVLLSFVALLFYLAWRSFDKETEQQGWQKPDFVFLLVAFLTTLWGRWPHFVDVEYNPDESACLAAANRPLDFFGPFVGGDVTTIGPLQVLPLTIPSFLGLTMDYGAARLLGLVSYFFGIVCLFFIGKKLSGNTSWPRAVVLVFVFYETFFTHHEMLAYSSEQIPTGVVFLMLLLALDGGPESIKPLARASLIGILGGSIGFLKLQFAPIAASIGIFYLVRLRAKKLSLTGALCMVSSSLLVPAILLVWMSRYEGVQNFWVAYVEANLQYTETVRLVENHFIVGFGDSSELPLIQRVKEAFHSYFSHDPEIRSIYWSSVIAMLCGAIAIREKRQYRLHTCLAAGFFALSLMVAVLPGNHFPHYARIGFLPAGLLCMIFLQAMKASRKVSFGFVALMLLPFLCDRYLIIDGNAMRPTPSTLFRGSVESPRHSPEIVKSTLRFAIPGESVAVWGWAPRIYSEGHFKMATRDTIGERVIEPRFDLAYYRKRYLREFRESQPTVFVDAIGHFMYSDRKMFGWESFPELKEIVDRDFRLVEAKPTYRIYLRNDKIEERSPQNFPAVSPKP